eukprot:scaffold141804_cov154-Phaeocystis_antarctica.AAC.1
MKASSSNGCTPSPSASGTTGLYTLARRTRARVALAGPYPSATMNTTLVGRLAGNGGGTARTMLVPTMTPTNNPEAHATRRSTTRLLFSRMGFGHLRSLRSPS